MSHWVALEFFAGIGGFAAAVDGRFPICRAFDISSLAAKWYQHSFSHAFVQCSIDGLKAEALSQLDANLWWLSPPCQPFTLKGRRLDWEDSRNRGFKNILALIPILKPKAIAMENVPGFMGSETHQRLMQLLESLNYHVNEYLICPSELGIPNQRRRYFSVAAQWNIPIECSSYNARTVQDFIRPTYNHDALLAVDSELVERLNRAIHICHADSRTTRCFTAGYGKNWVKSGSYLCQEESVRLFHPLEVAGLLGHELRALPPQFSHRQAWKLLGNGLSLFVMRDIVDSLIKRGP